MTTRDSDRLMTDESVTDSGTTLGALSSHGVHAFHSKLLRSSNNDSYLQRVAAYIRRYGHETPAAELTARNSMADFFGIEDWALYYGQRLSDEVIQKIPAFPWDEALLLSPCPFSATEQKVCETHTAFLGLVSFHAIPLTVHFWMTEKMKGRSQLKKGDGIPAAHPSLLAADCSRATCDFRWYLMPHIQIPVVERGWRIDDPPENYEIAPLIVELTRTMVSGAKKLTFPQPTHFEHATVTSSLCIDTSEIQCHAVVHLFGSFSRHFTLRLWSSPDLTPEDGAVRFAYSRILPQ